MRRPLLLIPLLVAFAWTGSATAQQVSGADLVRELSGNTLTGFNGSLWFTEYHAPDGRVFGQNGGYVNQDSCWKVRGDAVCYYYPRRNEQNERTEFCWHFERAGQDGYKIMAVGRGGSGFARLAPGNAQDRTDNGRAWTCDALVSQHQPRDPPPFRAAAQGKSRSAEAPLNAIALP